MVAKEERAVTNMVRVLIVLAIAVVLTVHAGPDAEGLLGFTPQGSSRQQRVEASFLPLPDASRAEVHLRELTRTPHTAGTEGARRVAEYVAQRFREYGLDTSIEIYDVLLSAPRLVEVELVAPHSERLGRQEEPVPEDPQSADPSVSGPWHAYAKSGEVTAEVVYVNYGRAEDYTTLARLGVEVRGRLVLARHFKGYRGGKSLEAERRGAAGIIVYSDPAEDGSVQGPVYPKGPWGPDSHVQRGSNVYDFIVPGDPLTPGWPSLPGARRIAESESRILPKIPSVPLSFRDARVILESLEGSAAPAEWQGGGRFSYHVGPGPARLHLKLDITREQRTIRDVIARLPGQDPAVQDQFVLLSNHHDAWAFGAVDPSSGTATALELARSLGELARRGMRPRRTIVFGIWDAEEFTLTGSTEWGEQHEAEISTRAVACLNVDAATQGDALSVGAVPALRPFIYQAARAVADPKGRGTLYDVWRRAGQQQSIRGYGVTAGERSADPPIQILGSGSDYTVFFNHLGVPTVDMLFDGPYGVYHSIYDSFEWMKRFGDPTFRYHAAMAQLWGVIALRLANADLLPFDYRVLGRDILEYVADVERVAKGEGVAVDLGEVRRAATALGAVSLGTPVNDLMAAAARNTALMQAERDLLAREGLPGRPWFRHLVYAPLPSYAAETLPGVREAIVEHDAARAQAQAAALAEALWRVGRSLGDGSAKDEER
jgi:N-acetylated-alpha-linked acidic dipeptidase